MLCLEDVILHPTMSENSHLRFSPGLPGKLLLISGSCTNMVSSNNGMRPKNEVLFYKPVTCRLLHESRYYFTAWADDGISRHLGRDLQSATIQNGVNMSKNQACGFLFLITSCLTNIKKGLQHQPALTNHEMAHGDASTSNESISNDQSQLKA